MRYVIFYLLSIFFMYFEYIKGITVNMMSFYYFSDDNFYQSIEQIFNNYSKEKNLNITLSINYFSKKNSTGNRQHLFTTTEALLREKSKKYDLYLFDIVYLKELSNHFIDLNECLSNEYLDLFKINDMDKYYVFNNRWIGLPIYIKFMVLYSNNYYLEKYNKKIPSTWDDLLQTGQDIIEQEQKNNNEINLYGYNGLFIDTNEDATCSMCSINQFVYSFREKKDSPFPYIKSQSTIDAFNKIKEIKEKISNDEIFKINEDQTVKFLREKILLFTSFWNSVLPKNFGYNETLLPGKNEGVSGSCLGGYNIGISKYIDDDHKKASLHVLKYFFTKEFQKEIVIKKFKKYSAIMDLYKDEEVCSILNCQIIRNLQLVNKTNVANQHNIFEYEHKYLKNFYDFLYGNSNVKTAIQNIENLTKFYYMNLDKDNIFGIIVFTIINIFVFIVLGSYIFSRIPKFKQYYVMYSISMWINYCGASLFIIYSLLMKFGKPSRFKCHNFILMLLTGYTMLNVPSLSFVIVHYPKWNNKYFKWIQNNEKKFLYISYIIEGLFILLSAFNPSFKPIKIYVDNSKNFYQCKIDTSNIFGFVLLIIELAFHVILFLILIVFLILEFNIKAIRPYMKSMLYNLSLDGVAFFALFLILMINKNSYYLECLCPFTVLLMFILKHIYMYFVSVWFEISSKRKTKEEEMINDLLKFNSGNETSEMSTTNATTFNTNNKSNVESTMKSSILDTNSRKTFLTSKTLL